MSNELFLPHNGLGTGDLIRIALPSLLYSDPIPLLLFDKIHIDNSIFAAFDDGDWFEENLLEILEDKGIVRIGNYTQGLALPNYAYYFFNEIYKERMGKYIFPPYREIGTEEFDEIILKERSAIGPLATLLVK